MAIGFTWGFQFIKIIDFLEIIFGEDLIYFGFLFEKMNKLQGLQNAVTWGRIKKLPVRRPPNNE